MLSNNKTNFTSSILNAILILILIQNCRGSVEPIDEKPKLDTLYSSTHFLWPSKIGNYWEFTRYIFVLNNLDENWSYDNFSSFGFNLDTVKNKQIYKLEIVDAFKNIILSDTFYTVHVFDTFWDQNYSNWLRPYYINDDGIYNLGLLVGQDTLFDKGLYLPQVITKNKKWRGYFFGRFEGGLVSAITENECLTISEKITTFSNDFNCYVVRTRYVEANDYPGFVDYYKYYAPNIGLVAQVKMFIVPNRYWFLEYVDILNYYNIIK